MKALFDHIFIKAAIFPTYFYSGEDKSLRFNKFIKLIDIVEHLNGIIEMLNKKLINFRVFSMAKDNNIPESVLLVFGIINNIIIKVDVIYFSHSAANNQIKNVCCS